MATLVRTGRYYSGGTPGLAHVAAGMQWAYAADTAGGSGTVIWHTIGARVGRVPNSAGTVTYQLAAMAVQSGQGSGGTRDVPGAVLARSANHSTSSTMDHGGAGQTVRHALTSIITSPRNRRFAFAAASQHNSLAVGMVHAASIGGSHNTWMYSRTAPSGVVQPGPGSGSNQGHMAIWLEGDLNERPNRPGPVTRSGGSTNRQPTMTAGFSDPNETLSNRASYDRLESHRHQVLWGGVSRWAATYTATAAERASRQSQRQIGVQVPFNTTVTYRVWHRDRLGAESLVRETTFSVSGGGSVDLPSSPTGRVTDPTNPGTIRAVYRNPGSQNAQWWRVGLFNEAGALIDSSPIFAPNGGVVPGAEMAASWPSTGFGTLANGTIYQLGVQVLVSPATGWSDWSTLTGFTTNAQPNTPVLYAPNADPRAVLPGLSVRVTDPDQPPSQVTVEIEVYDESDNPVATVNAPLNTDPALDNVYTVSKAALEAIIPDYGTYRWQAQANDGYLDSPWSDMFTLNYYPVPEVTITGPSSPVETMSPVLSVTSSEQTHWRVVGRNSNGDIVYDTGEQAGTVQNHTVATSMYWQGGYRWRNEQTINWTWMARNAAGLWGSSEAHPLTLSYIPPEPLEIVTAYAQSLPGATGTHYAELVHSQAEYGPDDQPTAVWSRVEIDGPGGTERPETYIPEYVRNANMGSTNLVDFDVTSRQWYRYGLKLEITRGVDVIESETTYAELMVEFGGVLLHMPFDPFNTFVWLPYGTERYEPEAEWIQGHHEVMTTNSRAPFGYSDNTDYTTWRHESVLVPRDGMTPEQQRDAFRRLWSYQNKNRAPNGRPNTVCFREGRGGDDARVYGRITHPRRVHSYTRLYTVDFEFQELAAMPEEDEQ